MIDDQPVGEAKRRLDIVDDRSAGLAERVMSQPMRGAGRGLGTMFEQLEPKIPRRRREHSPHCPGLGSFEVPEHRVAEVHVRRLAGGHAEVVALANAA